MTAENFVTKYIDIETKYFIKKQKAVLHDKLLEEVTQQNNHYSFDEVGFIINQLLDRQVKVRQPLFSKIIYPVLSMQVDLDNVDAIKLLLKLRGILNGYQELTGDYSYSYDNLIEKGLQLQPNDREMLQNRELTLRGYIGMTLHELPTGVLYESNGATIEECNELLKILDYYTTICDKLQVDHSELINEAKYYYQTYKAYISVYKQYHGFRDYLEKSDTKRQLT